MALVVLVSGDVVGPRMAGPAVRVVELGRVLAEAGHDVVVASAEAASLDVPAIRLEALDDGSSPRLAASADVVVGHGWPLERWPALRSGPGSLVIDLYDPFHLEGLVLDAGLPAAERTENHRGRMRALLNQLDAGDMFICAGERQRDMWLGALSARGRVTPAAYDQDHSLRGLLDIVGFGLPSQPPRPGRRAIRESFPAIEDGDLVLLWGGGLYDWFDPLTLVRAVALAAEEKPATRLVFHAAAHPSAAVAPMSVVGRTRDLSGELGLTGRHVFFNDTWVPYAERADWLCDADVGVSTHHPGVETEFAYRTRILDYVWAGLPILTTAGDTLADEVEQRGLGVTVSPHDVQAAARAIVRLHEARVRETARSNLAAFAAMNTWERVAEPLLRFCVRPSRAADKLPVIEDAAGEDRGSARLRRLMGRR